MPESIKSSSVYKRIFGDDFIYKAIYSLESYVFEKDLLEKDDYILMLKLRDPFYHEVISNTIDAVRKKMKAVLIDGDFFEAQVYFRPKKINADGELESRPLHSASLITLISSVVLLNILLLEIGNNEKSIELTELARMLPSNFYGNIPSEKPEHLFKPWYNQYKAYTEAITESYYDYTKTKEYKYEVTLDLKNFFPSINPAIIFDEVMKKYSIKYEGIDRECLKTILSKLLVFKITNLKSKEHIDMYYKSSKYECINGEVWSKGIPQGLPHAYFFGNICMIKVAEIFKKIIVGEEGKAFFYVDDSVIYTNDLKKPEELKDKIKKVNLELEKLSNEYIDKLDSYKIEAKGTSLEPFVNILHEFNYLIEVHPAESEKSTVIEIQNPKYGQANLNAYSKLASMTTYDLNKIFSDTEEINLSRKLEVIYEAVEKEIKRIRKIDPDEDTSNYIKVLLRFKKFFKYRQKRMEYSRNNDIKEVDIVELLEKFKISSVEFEEDMKKFFKSYDEDILLNEFRFFFANRPDFWELAEPVISEFNKITYKEGYKWTEGIEHEQTISYFHKMCKNLSLRRKIHLENNDSEYKSIQKIVKQNVWNISKSSKKEKESEIQKAINIFSTYFIKGKYLQIQDDGSKTILEIIKETELFAEEYNKYKLILLQTDELYRIVMNTYFSELISVETNDLNYLAKRNNKPIYYNEARVLLFVRNRKFRIDKFNLQFHNYKTGEALDYTIFEVVDYFEKFVQEPVYIDNLILVHKYTSDIWKNGSKYLHFYTLHNQDHAIELIRAITQFMKSVNYFQIDKRDYYILFISCYLHDISMVLHPNLIESFIKDNKSSNLIFSEFKRDILKLNNVKEFDFVEEQPVKKLLVDYFRKLDQYFEVYVRNNHPKQSAKFIRKSNDFNFVDDVIKDIVAEVSQAHGYNVDEIYKVKSNAEESIVSEKYLKILLRIGDLLDMSSNRISNAILDNSQKSMSDTTRFHWLSHKAISNVEVLVNYDFKETNNDENQSCIGPGAIIENVDFVIYLDVKHLIGTSKGKNCSLDTNFIGNEEEETTSSFNIAIGSIATCESCNFMCKWMKNKNEYLYSEIEALQQYLRRSEANLFTTNIKVKYVFNEGARRLKNSEYESILNYISNK